MNEIIEIFERLGKMLPKKEIMFYLTAGGDPVFRVRWMQSGGGVRQVRIVFSKMEVKHMGASLPDVIVRRIYETVVKSYHSIDESGNQP